MVRSNIIKRGLKMLREEGIRSFWFAILERTVYRRIIWMERPLNEPIPEVKARVPVVIGLLQESETDDYVNFQPKADLAEVRSLLKSGDECIIARYGTRIVSAAWVSRRRVLVEYLGREIQLAQGEVYAYDVFTAPDFRGHNIAGERSVWMLKHLRDAGYKRVIGYIVPENESSMRTIRRTGYRPFGVMGYIKLGALRHDFIHVFKSDDHSKESIRSASATV